MIQDNHFPSFFVGKKKKIKKRRASIVVKTSASKGRPRRGRISITAGEESEANVTCGFSQLSRQDVLEEGEHKRVVQIPHMFALFEDDSTIIMGGRRLRSLRLLNQRLLIFALFLLWQATKSSARTAFACGGLKTIETIGTIFFLACAPCLQASSTLACGGFKDNRDNRDNFFSCLQVGTGRRNGLSLLSLKPPQARKKLSLLSLLSLKKTRG